MVYSRLLLVAILVVIQPSLGQCGVSVSVINAKAGLFLDADSGAMRKDGCRVQLWNSNSSPQQSWEIVNVDGEYCKIICRGSGLCLDADAPHAGRNGAKVTLWRFHGGANQLWKIQYVGAGFVSIQNKAAGLFLDAHSPDTAKDGCRIQLWQKSSGRNQQFLLVVGENMKQVLRQSSRNRSVNLMLGIGKANLSTVQSKDPDFWRPDRTTGGQLGMAAGAIVATVFLGPEAAPEGITTGGIIGHFTDRIITRVSNDITGPAWRNLERSPVGQTAGRLAQGIGRHNPFR